MGEARQRQLMGMPPRGGNRGGNIEYQVKIEDTAEHICTCGCKYFMEVKMVRILSALLSPTGQESIIPVPALVCLKCGSPMDIKKAVVGDGDAAGKEVGDVGTTEGVGKIIP